MPESVNATAPSGAIDAHVHLDLVFAKPGDPWLTPVQLVDTMNRWGIDRAVLLPLVSPEASA